LRINILFLGPAKDLARCETASLDVAGGTTVAGLRQLISERFEGLSPALESVRFAVNEAFAADDQLLQAGDEIALIPPASGGASGAAILVDLVTDEIPIARVHDFVTGDPALGGIVTFQGATRRDLDREHGAVLRLEYEAYEGMARQQLERLAAEATRRWSAGRVAVIHRIGGVRPGELSVVIAVASVHRKEAFEACRWLIDTLKKDVPIWKKDVFEDGTTRWVSPDGGDRP
jgi:molybdopterin synthase catalytic subunit